jgi:hypothetical protein
MQTGKFSVTIENSKEMQHLKKLLSAAQRNGGYEYGCF